jgi:serine O-acetyltransferase
MYDNYFAQRGAYVGLSADFLGEPYVPHGWYGIFISSGAVIGKNVIILQQVTIGANSLSGTGRGGYPVVGNNVYIGAGAKIIGGVQVGNNCRIGANAVVYKNIPDNSVAVQSDTRIIVKENLDNRYFTFRNGKRVYFDDGKFVILQADEEFPIADYSVNPRSIE